MNHEPVHYLIMMPEKIDYFRQGHSCEFPSLDDAHLMPVANYNRY